MEIEQLKSKEFSRTYESVRKLLQQHKDIYTNNLVKKTTNLPKAIQSCLSFSDSLQQVINNISLDVQNEGYQFLSKILFQIAENQKYFTTEVQKFFESIQNSNNLIKTASIKKSSTSEKNETEKTSQIAFLQQNQNSFLHFKQNLNSPVELNIKSQAISQRNFLLQKREADEEMALKMEAKKILHDFENGIKSKSSFSDIKNPLLLIKLSEMISDGLLKDIEESRNYMKRLKDNTMKTPTFKFDVSKKFVDNINSAIESFKLKIVKSQSEYNWNDVKMIHSDLESVCGDLNLKLEQKTHNKIENWVKFLVQIMKTKNGVKEQGIMTIDVDFEGIEQKRKQSEGQFFAFKEENMINLEIENTALKIEIDNLRKKIDLMNEKTNLDEMDLLNPLSGNVFDEDELNYSSKISRSSKKSVRIENKNDLPKLKMSLKDQNDFVIHGLRKLIGRYSVCFQSMSSKLIADANNSSKLQKKSYMKDIYTFFYSEMSKVDQKISKELQKNLDKLIEFEEKTSDFEKRRINSKDDFLRRDESDGFQKKVLKVSQTFQIILNQVHQESLFDKSLQNRLINSDSKEGLKTMTDKIYKNVDFLAKNKKKKDWLVSDYYFNQSPLKNPSQKMFEEGKTEINNQIDVKKEKRYLQNHNYTKIYLTFDQNMENKKMTKVNDNMKSPYLMELEYEKNPVSFKDDKNVENISQLQPINPKVNKKVRIQLGNFRRRVASKHSKEKSEKNNYDSNLQKQTTNMNVEKNLSDNKSADFLNKNSKSMPYLYDEQVLSKKQNFGEEQSVRNQEDIENNKTSEMINTKNHENFEKSKTKRGFFRSLSEEFIESKTRINYLIDMIVNKREKKVKSYEDLKEELKFILYLNKTTAKSHAYKNYTFTYNKKESVFNFVARVESVQGFNKNPLNIDIVQAIFYMIQIRHPELFAALNRFSKDQTFIKQCNIFMHVIRKFLIKFEAIDQNEVSKEILQERKNNFLKKFSVIEKEEFSKNSKFLADETKIDVDLVKKQKNDENSGTFNIKDNLINSEKEIQDIFKKKKTAFADCENDVFNEQGLKKTLLNPIVDFKQKNTSKKSLNLLKTKLVPYRVSIGTLAHKFASRSISISSLKPS